MRETEGRTEKKEEGCDSIFSLFIANVKPCGVSEHYPAQYIRGQYCTLPAESTLIQHGENFQCGTVSCESTLIQ